PMGSRRRGAREGGGAQHAARPDRDAERRSGVCTDACGDCETGAVGNVRDVVTRACPDWPDLMEVAPELQFKHYAIRELGFPSDVLVAIGDVSQDEVNVCCDA